jgi:hypothetical protein
MSLLALAVHVSGCAPAMQTTRLSSTVHPAKPIDAPIELFYTKAPTRPYEELGIVSARQRNKFISMDQLTASIRQQAQRMGGDAVIGLSLGDKKMGAVVSGNSVIVDHDPVLQGVVVRWTDE